jgi:hypothetical protein
VQIKCDCQNVKAINDSWDNILNHFEAIRKNCPALKEILVPKSEWPIFRKMTPSAYDESGHRSILLGALKWGDLNKITLPVHCYLLDGEKPKDSLRKNYKKELIEKWMSEKTSLKRHQRVREFNGKLAELIASSWIESKGWVINNLEALNGSFDIEAISPQGSSSAIEVKYIGEEDWQFELNLESEQSGKAVSKVFNVYNGYNYILFRTYEAAKQLEKYSGDRYVFIVISNLTWGNLSMAIECDWIRHPLNFYEFSKWKNNVSGRFLKRINKYPNIEKEIKNVLNQIKELWIIKSDAWGYTIGKIITRKS